MLIQTTTNMYQNTIMLFNKSSFRKPTVPIYALSDNLIRNTNLLSPLHRSFGSTERNNKSIVGFVSCLLLQSSPPTVRKFIVAAIVNSINTSVLSSKFFYMILVAFIHIILKFFKRIPQTFNSTTSVPRKVRGIVVSASFF